MKFFLLVLMLTIPLTAHAEDVTYTTDSCEFEITFPEAPITDNQCDEKGRNCFSETSYTKVYDLATTITYNVTCNPAGEDAYTRYSEPVIATTLKGMAARHNLDTGSSEIVLRDVPDEARIASLTGQGRAGGQDKIYVGQIWVGRSSVMSVEAEMIGADVEPARGDFIHILQSIQIKAETDADENEETQDEDKDESGEEKEAEAKQP